MKRLRVILVSLVAVAGIISLAYGGSTDSLDIKVTLASNIEVNIQDTEFNFQTLIGGQTSVSWNAVTVENTSTSNREDWALKLDDTGSDWTAIQAGMPAQDEFLLMAQFGASAGTWTSTNHALTTSNQDCSVTQYFGNGTKSECGLDIPVSGTRSLWFRITMPSFSIYVSEQTIPVTVTASLG